MTHVIVGRRGKNLALRFPNEIAGDLSLREGDRLKIESEADRIVIRRAKPHYALEEMFAGKFPAEWRAIYADSYDWGPEVGREIIEE